MALLELSAHMTVRPGCLEGFKKQAARSPVIPSPILAGAREAQQAV
jgi:hypothetical protein